MFKPMTYALALCAVLAGCGTVRDSALNPFNWFGRSQDVPLEQSSAADGSSTASAQTTNPLIPQRRQGIFARARAAADIENPTTPIAQIATLQIERVPGGAIIRASGIDSFANSYDAGLLPQTVDETPVDGVLVYSFRRRVPEGTQPGGAEATREITVARFVSDQTLRGVRSIRVEAASNARAVRR